MLAVVSLLASLTTVLGVNPGIAAAASDSKGTEYWLAFPGNYTGSSEKTLFISGDTATSGTVEVPGLSFSQGFNVTPGTVTSVELPAGTDIHSSDVVAELGVHVTAGAEVSVYGLNRYSATTDAYLGLPVDILGTAYTVMSYQNVNVVNGTEFAVVAPQDATTVTITPSVTTGTRTAGVPYNVSLDKGDTYQLRNTDPSPADLTGTIVTSNKPIAVFGGHQCANIPEGNVACDHIVEQIPPNDTWGKSFVTMPLATRTKGDTFRILASEANTAVSINGSPVATLGAGGVHEQIITGPATITADKPVLVAQFSNSSSFDGVTSDPFMMLIPPYEQFLSAYTVTTPAEGFLTNYINLVVPNSGVGGVKVDGTAVPAGDYTAIGSSGFSGVQVPVALGSHTLTGGVPFGAFMYGFDSYDSYGYPGGMSLAPVARVESVTLAPETANKTVGTQHCVSATVLDQNDTPLAGVRVDFTVTGANPGSGFANTDANGVAQHCYTGTAEGNDTITGAVGNLSDTATATWTKTPTNAPPVVDAGPAVSGDTGAALALNGSATDPDGDPLTLAWSIDPACSITPANAAVATVTCTAAGTYTATLTADDGHNPAVSDTTTVTVSDPAPDDTTPPVCELVSASSAGITVRTIDSGSGLQAITVTRDKNATVNVPTFTPGTTSEQLVTATKIKAGQGASVQLEVTDVAGNKTVCDPVIAKLTAGEARTFHGVPAAEHFLTVSEAAGVAGVAVEVGGSTQIVWSPDGRTVDLGDMGDGTVTLRVLAPQGTTATIMLWDGK